MNPRTIKKEDGSFPWRSVGAVFAGFFVGAALSLGTDEALHLFNVYPPWGQMMSDGLFLFATAYRVVFNIAGCYVAACLAPNRPMRHALTIGFIGLALGGLAAVATWNKVPPIGPHWYAIVVAPISLPCAWVGGVLQRRSA